MAAAAHPEAKCGSRLVLFAQGTLSAIVHPRIQMRDFEPIAKGEPVFLTMGCDEEIGFAPTDEEAASGEVGGHAPASIALQVSNAHAHTQPREAEKPIDTHTHTATADAHTRAASGVPLARV